MFDFDFNIMNMLLRLPGIVIGLSFHEFAHAYTSYRLGDPTPRQQGRLSLSPVPHIDPIGFLLIFLVGFGWAKPVQVNPRYYKNPSRDEMLVSIAGPAMNLCLAFLFAGVYKLIFVLGLYTYVSDTIFNNLMIMIFYTININIVLMLFNLIPLPPLDGSHILFNLLPYRFRGVFYRLEQYSTIILILLIVSGATGYIIGIPGNIILTNIGKLFGI